MEPVEPIEPELLPPKVDSKKAQEEKELLEVSLMDDDEDFPMQQLDKVEKESKPITAPVVVAKSPAVSKTVTAKPINIESTIFNELNGIDFDKEINAEDEGTIDWNTVKITS